MKSDQSKTKAELIQELHSLRKLTNKDITDRMQAEEALLESERKLQEAQRIAHLGYWEWDFHSHTSYWSDEMYAIFKRSKELGPLSEDRIDYVTPEDRERVKDAVYKAHTLEQEYNLDHGIVCMDGEIRYIHTEGRLVHNDQGNPIKMVGTVQDITDRKLMEEKATLFSRIFEDSLNEVYLFDSNTFHFIQVNDAALNNLGYTMEELNGLTPFDLKPKFNPDSFAKLIAPLREGKTKQIVFETVHKRKDGSLYDVEVHLQLLKNEHAALFAAIIKDITHRKRTEEALRESENKYRTLFEQSADAILIIEGDKFVDCNSATVKMLGYTNKKELLETHPSQLSPQIQPDGRKSFEKANEMMSIALNQGSHRFEWDHKRKNGEVFPVEVLLTAIPFGEGDFLHVVWRDITDRKQAEEVQRESEERYRSLIESVPDSIIISDQTGHITMWNNAAQKIFGYNADEIIGKSITKIIPESYRVHHQNGFKRLTNTGEERRVGKILELEGLRKTGDVFPLELSISSWHAGDMRFFAAIIRDITDRKQAEEERVALETQLRRSQKLETIGTLAGGIAHDFNNILTPILGYTDMALDVIPSYDPLHKDFKKILKGTHRAKDLVNRILLFSKQVEKERKPIYLPFIIKEALKLLRPSIPTTIKIKRVIDKGCDNILADATQIHQVIVNLCTNAWQAMEAKGGILTIELKQLNVDKDTAKLYPNIKEQDYALLTIRDTGIGMDEKTIERIFEPFFTTKAVDMGTGLGLSVVHGIIRSHDGDIMVDSKPDKGATFHVYLPTIKTKIELDIKKDTVIKGGHESILLVDDDVEVARVIEIMLERLGYKVVVFNNSVEALKTIRQDSKKYDLVISDLTMPDFTGLDLAKQIQKVRRGLPIIITTGFGNRIPPETQKKYGIKQILAKPITKRQLAIAIRGVLDN